MGMPAAGSAVGATERLHQPAGRKRKHSERLARLQDLSQSSGAHPSEPFTILKPLALGAAGSAAHFLVLEVFAGSMHLSEALRDVGCSAIPIDIKIGGAAHDLSKAATVVAVKQLCPQYAHLAPCCNTYSSARWPKLRPPKDGAFTIYFRPLPARHRRLPRLLRTYLSISISCFVPKVQALPAGLPHRPLRPEAAGHAEACQPRHRQHGAAV